jgi:hypothetical protein
LVELCHCTGFQEEKEEWRLRSIESKSAHADRILDYWMEMKLAREADERR